MLGTERKPRSFPRDVTGLETLCGLVGLLSLPSDALTAWRSGRLPERLFWCEELLAMASAADKRTPSFVGEVGEVDIGWAAADSVSVG